ncbi:hypothetical protein ACYPKM_04380 [Pseudomonas aeruginosa]
MPNTTSVTHAPATLVAEALGTEAHRIRLLSELSDLLGQPSEMAHFQTQAQVDLANTNSDLYLFLGDHGPVFGIKPASTGLPGDVIDDVGEQACIEDFIMNVEAMSWEEHSAMLTLLCQIDPRLPFDVDHPDHEPFCVALNQHPDVLFEDREIPAHLVSAVKGCALLKPSVAGMLP